MLRRCIVGFLGESAPEPRAADDCTRTRESDTGTGAKAMAGNVAQCVREIAGRLLVRSNRDVKLGLSIFSHTFGSQCACHFGGCMERKRGEEPRLSRREVTSRARANPHPRLIFGSITFIKGGSDGFRKSERSSWYHCFCAYVTSIKNNHSHQLMSKNHAGSNALEMQVDLRRSWPTRRRASCQSCADRGHYLRPEH